VKGHSRKVFEKRMKDGFSNDKKFLNNSIPVIELRIFNSCRPFCSRSCSPIPCCEESSQTERFTDGNSTGESETRACAVSLLEELPNTVLILHTMYMYVKCILNKLFINFIFICSNIKFKIVRHTLWEPLICKRYSSAPKYYRIPLR
jgi:hypothetical protein